MSLTSPFLTSLKHVAFAVIVATTLAHGQEAWAAKGQLQYSQSSFEWHFVNEVTDKARLNLFYNLPFNIRGYSFMDFNGTSGFYGKDNFNIPIPIDAIKKLAIDVKIETKHQLTLWKYNTPVSSYESRVLGTYYNTAGVGLEKGILFPNYSYLSFKFIPLSIGKDGIVEKNMIAGYFLALKLYSNSLVDIEACSYIDINVAGEYMDNGKKRSMVWDYGENHLVAYFKTSYGKFYLGGGLNHDWSGEFSPENNAVIKIGYHLLK